MLVLKGIPAHSWNNKPEKRRIKPSFSFLRLSDNKNKGYPLWVSLVLGLVHKNATLHTC